MYSDKKRDKCPICGSYRFTPQFQVPFPNYSSMGWRGFSLKSTLDVPAWVIVKCLDCSVRYPNPFPTEKDITNYYALQMEPTDWEIEHYVEVSLQERATRARLVESLEVLNGSAGSLLEIGCAAGWLLSAARNRGWEVCGIEAAPKFYKYAAHELKLPVMQGTLENIDPNVENVYDIIVMMDTIEHLYNPIADLKRIRKIIKDKGFLMLTTCNIDSACARAYGLNWRQIVVSHTFYWTKHSMVYALRQAGFIVEHFSEPRYWHPDVRLECLYHIVEIAKFIIRIFLSISFLPIVRRFPCIQHAISKATNGRLDFKTLMYKIGDHPVLGDVMLIIARPI